MYSVFYFSEVDVKQYQHQLATNTIGISVHSRNIEHPKQESDGVTGIIEPRYIYVISNNVAF